MKNPPAFQFYPQDFLSDLNVQSMTDEEVGIYIKLLCHCWIEDGLPVDGGSRVVDKWLKQSPAVARCFVEKKGKYRNKRLDEERDKQIRWRDKSRIGGLHSAENKRLRKGGSTKGEPSANSSVFSSPLHTSIRDKNIGHRKADGPLVNDPFLVEFIGFWDAYPEKKKKKDAFKAFKVLRHKGVPIETIAAAFNGYMDFLKTKRVKDHFEQRPMYAATFLRGDRWKEYIGEKYTPPL
jgi:uncharacterized protein YdaU (DUF1376 family)